MKYVAIGLVLAIWIAIPARSQEHSGWQTANIVQVVLTLRNKFAQGNYPVQFVATCGGKTFTVRKQAHADEEVTAIFPTDFQGGTESGVYKWQALVRGKAVASGWFSYKDVGVANKFGFRDSQVTFHEN